MRFMRKYGVLIDTDEGSIYFKQQNEIKCELDNVTCLTKETIPPFTEKLIRIKPILIPGHEFLLTMCQYTNINHGLLIWSAIISQDNIYVPVLNLTNRDMNLHEDTCLCHLEPVEGEIANSINEKFYLCLLKIERN